MEKINRINFENLKINDYIEVNNYGLKDKFLIYKVIKIDYKTYNAGYNEYYKLVQCELISVPNGDINFYKEVNKMKKYITFYEYGKEFLTLEGYKIIK